MLSEEKIVDMRMDFFRMMHESGLPVTKELAYRRGFADGIEQVKKEEAEKCCENCNTEKCTVMPPCSECKYCNEISYFKKKESPNAT